ncbi:hypothetical protein [Arthrobacter pityocampae]|uniref:hypothetical protein n=1 Tax=Arthrobacter pityocampae TaxID=547334 RepID=UPI0037364CEB
MMNTSPASATRLALASLFLALISVGVALSTLFVASVAIKVVMLVVAAFVLAATGASLAVVLAQSRPPVQR